MRELSPTETLIHRTTPLQLEVIVRNIATGSLCRRLPFEQGRVLSSPIVELNLKDDGRHNPLINEDHALALGLVTCYDELAAIEEYAIMIDDVLQGFFRKIGITLVDFKLEFGRTESDDLLVINEFSPDTCRLWDANTGQSLDKDILLWRRRYPEGLLGSL